MKQVVLVLSIISRILFLSPNISEAESMYDFVEYDVKTKTERVIPFDESMYEGMPDVLEAKKPQGLIESRGILGEDDRELVKDTSKFPYSAIAQLEYVNTGYSTVASGALIQNDLFLTCAHAVWNNGFLSDGIIVPGREGYWNKPFGEAKMEKIYILKEYMANKQIGNDFALVKLDRPIGEKTGWLGLSYSNKAGEMLTLSGYPGGKNFYMYTESQPINEMLRYKVGEYEYERLGWEKDALFYLLDSEGGQSGSPMYDYNAQVSSVHTSGGISGSQPIYNCGSRVSKEKFAVINHIIKEQGEYIPVEKIEINPDNAILEYGESINLKPVFTPENATYQDVEWSIDKLWENIIEIDQNGKVTIPKGTFMIGPAVITAKTIEGEKIATCKLTIVQKKVPVTGIEIEPKELTLDVGETKFLNAKILPKNVTNKKYVWSSSEESIARVTTEGEVKAIKAGKAIITAKTDDGGKIATSEIIVTDRTDAKGVFGTVPWSWEKETQTLTFKGGQFFDTGNDNYIYEKIEKLSELEGKPIKKIVFTEPIELAPISKQLFFCLTKVETIDGANYLDTSKVVDMTLMFYNTLSLTSLDISKWDVSNVKKMHSMFLSVPLVEELELNNWNTKNVENINFMFNNMTNLKKLHISNWDTGKVKEMHRTFDLTTSLTELNLKNWNMNSVENVYTFTAINHALEKVVLGENCRLPISRYYGAFPTVGGGAYTGRWLKVSESDEVIKIYESANDFFDNYDGNGGIFIREKK